MSYRSLGINSNQLLGVHSHLRLIRHELLQLEKIRTQTIFELFSLAKVVQIASVNAHLVQYSSLLSE